MIVLQVIGIVALFLIVMLIKSAIQGTTKKTIQKQWDKQNAKKGK